jgi:ABC-type phosphate/phosphonate transport system permease subunit
MWNRAHTSTATTHSFAAVPRIKIDSVDKNVTLALETQALSFFELLVFEILVSSFWANQKQAIYRAFARNNQPNFIEF